MADRKEVEVRRMLDVRYPPAPAGLTGHAMARGRRLLRRRRMRHTALWLLLAAVVLAAAVCAAVYWHAPQPLDVGPPVRGG